jgi:hypothetical protein
VGHGKTQKSFCSDKKLASKFRGRSVSSAPARPGVFSHSPENVQEPAKVARLMLICDTANGFVAAIDIEAEVVSRRTFGMAPEYESASFSESNFRGK